MFIPLQPENILIELPTLPSCISLTSAPGLGFCCVPSLLEHLSPLPPSPSSRLSELIPMMMEAFGPWAQCGSTGASILPPKPFPWGSPAQAGERGKYFCGCIRVFLAPAFPVDTGSLCTTGASPAALNALPSALHSLQAFPTGFWAFSTGSCPGPNLEELLSLHVHSCVLSTHLQCCAQGSWCFEPRGDLGVPLFSSCIISLWSCW